MKQQEINKLLDQYRLGTISVENRRLLEQLSVEDDFVFDALQGMKNANSSSSKSMDELRQRLEDRVKTQKKGRISPFWYSGAAAAILLLVTAVWLFNIDDSPNNDSVFAEAKKEEVRSDLKIDKKECSLSKEIMFNEKAFKDVTSEESTSIITSQNANHANRDLPAKPSPSAVEEKVYETIENVPFEDNDIAGAPQKIDSDPINEGAEAVYEEEKEASAFYAEADDDNVLEYSSDEDAESLPIGDLNSEYSPERSSASPAQTSRKKSKIADKFKREADKRFQNNVSKSYEGFVYDPDGSPLIGASISIKGTEIGVITNLEGKARLDDINIEDPVAVVTYIGFETKEFKLKDGFKIYLQDGDVVLEEVVVAGYGVASEAQPLIGWDKFNEIVDNQINNSGLSETQINEIVQIDFTINSDGKPTNIKIIKGKNNPKASFLIQLLNTSGKWSSGKGSYSF